MKFTLRLMWAFVLLLAIPLQGFAAATMLHCSSAPSRVTVGVSMPCHVVADAVDAAVGDSSSTDGCSACAAFCHGGAVAGIPLALPLEASEFAPILTTTTFPSGFISAGLERPPRRAA